MKQLKIALIAISAIAIAALTAVTANASLLIEPHLGYNVYGNADYSATSSGIPIDAKTKYNGPQYGARLGVQYFGLMGGLDYTHSSFTHKTTITSPAVPGYSATANADKKRDQFGLFVGYKFPVFVRAWFGYYFSDKLKNSDTAYWEKGNGTELGIGFTGIPFLSINLQYRTSSYDKDIDGALSPNHKTSEFVLGVSAPFTLL